MERVFPFCNTGAHYGRARAQYRLGNFGPDTRWDTLRSCTRHRASLERQMKLMNFKTNTGLLTRISCDLRHLLVFVSSLSLFLSKRISTFTKRCLLFSTCSDDYSFHALPIFSSLIRSFSRRNAAARVVHDGFSSGLTNGE